jgi:HK97 family phage major capsid protein
LTETEPALKEIEFNIYKIGGFSYVSNELLADSPQSVEAILQRVFGRAIAAMEDYAFLRWTGAGMPRGILNGPASIAIAPDTNSAFAAPDALEMVSRFQADGGEPHWLAHRSLIPDFSDTSFDGAGGDMSVLPKTANVFGRPIYGYPVYLSEHLPLADASGCIILADLSAYGIFDREGLAISFSEHFRFTNDQGTFRFTKRLDGDQLWTGTRTLGGPGTAFTISPFVYFND